MTGPVDHDYSKKVCKIGQGNACCRYIGADKQGLCCLKGTFFQPIVDRKVRAGEMVARADNCVGWENLEAI